MSNGLVVLIGIGVVFVGLILIIIAIVIMNALMRFFVGKQATEPVTKPAVASNAHVEEQKIPHGELVAIMAAAIVAETGTSAEGLRIVSIKRV